ncbi:MAG: RICIN domain-containing protein [Myxococcota bacterium]
MTLLRPVLLSTVALVGLFASSDAQAARFYFTVENVGNGLCIDVPGFYSGATWVQQYSCNNGHNQYWQFVTNANGYIEIDNLSSGLCLEFPGWSTANHQPLQQYPCNGGSNQEWTKVDLGSGEFALVNRYSGKCLDVAGGSTSSGYYLQQYSCHYGPNQRFEYGPIGISISH